VSAALPPPRLVPEARELVPVLGNRDLFGGLDPLVYMNHAGISPPSVVVRRAVSTLLTDYGKRGAAAYPTWAAQRSRLRGKLAELVNAASPDDLALTQNTTRGIIDVALCFPWAKGDRIVVFEGEFPSNVTPWQRAALLFGLEVVMLDGRRYLADEAGALEELERTLTSSPVRMVAVSAVQFQTGFRMPLAEMARVCRGGGARLFVDAVQACGMTPVDVRADEIDFLACGAHKWMMGIEGAGFVYAKPAAARLLSPRVAGWLSHESAIDFLFDGPNRLRYDKPIRGSIDFLEVGNLSATAFAALEASLDLLRHLGAKVVFEHVQQVNDAIEGRAVELGFISVRSPEAARRSGTLALLPPPGVDVVALGREITAQGVACATPDGHVRFSPHFSNAVDEADQVVLTLEHAVRQCRSA